MGEVKDFLKYKRQEIGHRPVKERIYDFDELDLPPQDHVFIPLSLDADFEEEVPVESREPDEPEPIASDDEDDDEIAVNWQLLADNANVLTRLQNLSQSE